MSWATDGLDMDPERREVGRMRMTAFATGQAMVQAEAFALTMSVAVTPGTGYSDEAISAMRHDADDLVRAAQAWAASCHELARDWKRQRIADERRRNGG